MDRVHVRVGGGVLDRLAEAPDVDVDRAGGGEVVVSPDLSSELLARHQAARGLREGEQELELLQAQVCGDSAHCGAQLRGLDDEIAGLDRLVGFEHGAFPDAAQVRADTREELLHGERLRDVVVGARVQAAHGVALLAERGDHDDRDIGVGAPYPVRELEPVDPRQHEVEQDEVGRRVTRHLQRLDAVSAGSRCEACAPQRVVDGLSDDRVVFDNEDVSHVHPSKTVRRRRYVLYGAHHGARPRSCKRDFT